MLEINLFSLIISQLHKLSVSDDMDIWRASASKNLASKIQSNFEALQNPVDCQSAKKLICDLNKSCGYGCQIHHVKPASNTATHIPIVVEYLVYFIDIDHVLLHSVILHAANNDFALTKLAL